MENTMIKTINLKKYAKDNGLKLKKDVIFALDKAVKEILNKAFERTKKNGKICIREYDI